MVFGLVKELSFAHEYRSLSHIVKLESYSLKMAQSSMTNDLPIYLISLEHDQARRANLEEQFSKFYKDFQRINAVDGRLLSASAYYTYVLPYYLHSGDLISPSEVGCSLSHINALTRFLKSDEERALILEDDIIGNDTSIERIKRLALQLPMDAILICGQRQGRSNRLQFGRAFNNNELYEVLPFSYRFVYGTCCYVVTRRSAKDIIEQHEKCLLVADKWDVLCKSRRLRLFYVSILSHLNVEAESNIKNERENRKKTLVQKITDGRLLKRMVDKILTNIGWFIHIIRRVDHLP